MKSLLWLLLIMNAVTGILTVVLKCAVGDYPLAIVWGLSFLSFGMLLIAVLEAYDDDYPVLV